MGHGGTEGEKRYSSTLSLFSVMFPTQFHLRSIFVVRYQFAAVLDLMKSQLAGFDVVRWLPGW